MTKDEIRIGLILKMIKTQLEAGDRGTMTPEIQEYLMTLAEHAQGENLDKLTSQLNTLNV